MPSNFIVNADGTTEPMADVVSSTPTERLKDLWKRFNVVGTMTHRTACNMQTQLDIPPSQGGIRGNTIRKLKDKYPYLLRKHCAKPDDPTDAEFMAMATELVALCAELKLNAEYLRTVLEPVPQNEEEIEKNTSAKQLLFDKGMEFIKRYGGQADGRIGVGIVRLEPAVMELMELKARIHEQRVCDRTDPSDDGQPYIVGPGTNQPAPTEP